MPNRRNLLLLSALSAGGGLLGMYSYLSGQRQGNALPNPAPIEAFSPGRTVTIGFIYVGAVDDGGYNQSHAQAARLLADIPWITVVEQADVPEDSGVVDVMRRMIEEDGASFVFPTSYGYFDPHLLSFSPLYPEVRFLHTGGLALPGHPKNISSSYGYIDEAMFLCGLMAGAVNENNELGFVAAIPIPVVRRNVNAFTLGAKLSNPDARVHVRFTGSWSDQKKELQICSELNALEVATIACHVDSPPAIMRFCEENGLNAIGYHINQSNAAPTRLLTGAQWNWFDLYRDYLISQLKGEAWPTMKRGGLKDGVVTLSPISDRVPEATQQRVKELLSLADQDQFYLYEGPVLSNEGELLVPFGSQRRQDDPWLETTDWFVNGVETVSD